MISRNSVRDIQAVDKASHQPVDATSLVALSDEGVKVGRRLPDTVMASDDLDI